MKKISTLIYFLTATLAFSQTVTVDGQFSDLVTYYISSIDIETGATDFQFFSYELSCDDCPKDGDNLYDPPVLVDVTFEISIESPALGFDNEETIAYLYTKEPFEMYAPIHLDNRDFTIDAMEINDIYGNPVPLKVGIDSDRTLETDDLMDKFSTIVTSAQLPDGVYRFSLGITAEHDGITIPVNCPDCDRVLAIRTPVSLALADGNPGGPWDDLLNNLAYTTFPVFNWESDLLGTAVMNNCLECGFYIRVAEFRCEDHASVEDAIDDVTTLPINQADEWYYIGNQLSVMYPPTGAIELVAGGIYVYQVQRRVSTTEGVEPTESPIFVFKVAEDYNQYLEDIKGIINEDVYNALFTPCGPLTGYTSSGAYKLDGIDRGEAEWYRITELKDEFIQGEQSVINTEVQ